MGRLRLGELLVETKLIRQAQLDEALAAQARAAQSPAGSKEGSHKLGQVLVDLGFVTETQLTQTLSQQLSVPWVSLYHIDFSRELLNLVPKEVAQRYCLLPVFVRKVRHQGHTLYVAMDDPTNEAGLEAVQEASGLPTRPMIAAPSDIRGALRAYYDADPEPKGSLSQPAAALVPVPGSILPPPPVAPTVAVAPPPAPAPASRYEDSASGPTSGDSPDDDPIIEAREIAPKRGAAMARMVALTLLDGTTINVPARPEPTPTEATKPVETTPTQLTTRELVLALRAVAHGAEVSDVLGDRRQWEPMFAALLSLMLKKGLIADWEFLEELKKL